MIITAKEKRKKNNHFVRGCVGILFLCWLAKPNLLTKKLGKRNER